MIIGWVGTILDDPINTSDPQIDERSRFLAIAAGAFTALGE
jgi:hypothetical protein